MATIEPLEETIIKRYSGRSYPVSEAIKINELLLDHMPTGASWIWKDKTGRIVSFGKT